MDTLPFKTRKSLRNYYWSLLDWLYEKIIKKVFFRNIQDTEVEAWLAGANNQNEWYDKNGFIFIADEYDAETSMRDFPEIEDMIEAAKRYRNWLRDQEIM